MSLSQYVDQLDWGWPGQKRWEEVGHAGAKVPICCQLDWLLAARNHSCLFLPPSLFLCLCVWLPWCNGIMKTKTNQNHTLQPPIIDSPASYFPKYLQYNYILLLGL